MSEHVENMSEPVRPGLRQRSACPYLPYRRLCYHRLERSSSGGGWFSQTPWREAEACGGFKGALAAPLAGHGQKSSAGLSLDPWGLAEPAAAAARASEPVIAQPAVGQIRTSGAVPRAPGG